MKIKNADLLTIAVKRSQYPQIGPPEIAFLGRSNVGKSSLLNLLTGRKALARVSGSPGKTRTINFFSVNSDQFRIVDLPGYGYAKVSKSLSATWGDMIEAYLADRESLVCAVQLVDIRHEPSVQDIQMYEWLKYHELDGIVVATKSDKINKSALNRQLAMIRSVLGMSDEDALIACSALKKQGVDKLLMALGEVLGQ